MLAKDLPLQQSSPPLCPLSHPPSLPSSPLFYPSQDKELAQPKDLPIFSKFTKPMTQTDMGDLSSPCVPPPSHLHLWRELFREGTHTLPWLDSILRQHWWTSWDLPLANRFWNWVGLQTQTDTPLFHFCFSTSRGSFFSPVEKCADTKKHKKSFLR